jgi:hypothetical protein
MPWSAFDASWVQGLDAQTQRAADTLIQSKLLEPKEELAKLALPPEQQEEPRKQQAKEGCAQLRTTGGKEGGRGKEGEEGRAEALALPSDLSPPLPSLPFSAFCTTRNAVLQCKENQSRHLSITSLRTDAISSPDMHHGRSTNCTLSPLGYLTCCFMQAAAID